MALNFGTSAAQNSMVSAISRSDGSGGQIQVPREAYSLRMSFWMVPVSLARGYPFSFGGGDVERQQDRRRPVDRHARADLVQRDAVEQDLGVGQGVHRDADPADLLAELGIVGVVAALGGQVERHRQPRPSLVQQVAVAAVGFLGGAETRILAKRPELAAVAGREVTPGERELPGRRGLRRYSPRPVYRRKRNAGWCLSSVIHR